MQFILLTGPYSLSCKQEMSLVFGICPIILWYLGYLKQEKTKKSSNIQKSQDRLKFFPYKSSRERKARIYLINRQIGFFSEPFDQNKKVMAFLMQNRPMAYNFLQCDFLLQQLLHTLPLVIFSFLSREVLQGEKC